MGFPPSFKKKKIVPSSTDVQTNLHPHQNSETTCEVLSLACQTNERQYNFNQKLHVGQSEPWKKTVKWPIRMFWLTNNLTIKSGFLCSSTQWKNCDFVCTLKHVKSLLSDINTTHWYQTQEKPRHKVWHHKRPHGNTEKSFWKPGWSFPKGKFSVT